MPWCQLLLASNFVDIGHERQVFQESTLFYYLQVTKELTEMCQNQHVLIHQETTALAAGQQLRVC